MERKIFHKAKLATAIALVSTTTLLTGCIVDGDRSSAVTTTVQEDASRISITDQATPLAQILGLVQDTNGNPVVGARVSIGNAAATTDANGAYAISNVPVTGFTGNASGAAATALQVSIVPASGTHLNATVSVTPQASTIVQTIDGASGNTEDALLAIVTTDGLAVSAGITVVPAMQSNVTGVLRDAATGEVVANTVIGLELLGVNGVGQQQTQNAGAGTSYGVSTFQAATDANGVFSFTALPMDAEFDLAIEGWTFSALAGGVEGTKTLGGEFSTTPEVANQNIGTVTANLITSADAIAPFVTSVNGVVVNAATGVLNDDLDGTQGLTVNFSEPLQQIADENSIYMYNKTLSDTIDIASFAQSADGKSLTITTANPIAQDQEFEIYLSVVDFQDIANNVLDDSTSASNPATFQGQATPLYDDTAGVTSVGTVRLTLKTFADPVTEANAVVGLVQELGDAGTSAFELIQSLNTTFADVDTGTVRTDDLDIEQLNDPLAATLLTDLSNSTYTEPGLGADKPAAVKTDVARIQFTIVTDPTAADFTESDTYLLTLTDTSGNLQDFTVVAPEVAVDPTNITVNGDKTVTIVLEDGFSGDLDLLLDGVEPNDTITISSLTSFGTVDGVVSQVLTDQIAPTTVLQRSYGQGLKTDATVGVSYGNGGELAELTTATVGTPIINITPRLITPQAGLAIPLPVASTWTALRDEAQDTAPDDGNSDVNLTANTFTPGITAYDATAIAAWSVGQRTIGIAVSEDVSLTATDPVDDAVQVLDGWTVQNDVVKNDIDGDITAIDLIHVDVPNVIDFANVDHGKTIDFTNAITDASGNVAAAGNNAKVVIRDLMPPLLTSAVYNGEQIVLTYNENVVLDGDTDFILDAADLGAANNVTITATADNTTVVGNTVTISRADIGDLDSEVSFDRGTFDHDGDNNVTTADAAHGVIYSVEVQDANGTSWANWDGGVGLVDIPGIAIRDDAGVFELSGSPTPTNFTATSTSFTVVYRFSHRIDLEQSGLTNTVGATTLTGAEVDAAFTLTSAATIVTGSTSATLDGSGRVLTVTVATSVGVSAADTFGLTGGAIATEWDTNDADITTLTDITVPQ